MRKDGWTLVWAEFPDAEPGAYFLNHGRYVDVWGGVAAGDSEKQVAAWAIRLSRSMPRPLARYFGWYVVAGREHSPPARPNPFSR